LKPTHAALIVLGHRELLGHLHRVNHLAAGIADRRRLRACAHDPVAHLGGELPQSRQALEVAERRLEHLSRRTLDRLRRVLGDGERAAVVGRLVARIAALAAVGVLPERAREVAAARELAGRRIDVPAGVRDQIAEHRAALAGVDLSTRDEMIAKCIEREPDVVGRLRPWLHPLRRRRRRHAILGVCEHGREHRASVR